MRLEQVSLDFFYFLNKRNYLIDLLRIMQYLIIWKNSTYPFKDKSWTEKKITNIITAIRYVKKPVFYQLLC